MIAGGAHVPSLPRELLDRLGLPEVPRLVGLFEGYGGLTLGTKHALGGGTLLGYSEIEPTSLRLLAEHFPDAEPIGDVSHVDWSAWLGRVDVLLGGFPCQDVSVAGVGRGLKVGTRSGLWYEFARGIAALRPTLVVIENVSGLRSTLAGASAEVDDEADEIEVDLTTLGGAPVLRALGAVLGDLASIGYDAEWYSLRAADVGAPHRRERCFIIATPARHTPVDPTLAPIGYWDPERVTWNHADGAIDLFADHPEPFAATWPRAGAMRLGVAYERPAAVEALATPTLFVTPLAADAQRDVVSDRARELYGATTLSEQVTALLPTPVASGRGDEHDYASPGKGKTLMQALGDQLELFPTPDAYAGTRGGGTDPARRRAAGHSVSLEDSVTPLLPTPRASRGASTSETVDALLPTPTVGDSRGGRNSTAKRSKPQPSRGRGETLTDAADKLLPTPTVALASGGQTSRGGDRDDEPLLPGIAEALFPTPTSRDYKDTGDFTLHTDKRKLAHTVMGELNLFPTPVAAEGLKGATTLGSEEKARTGQVWLTNVAHDLGDAMEIDGILQPDGTVLALADVDWGVYEAAVRRAEAITGRPAPSPVNADGTKGAHRLAPEFVEWMMLLEPGWVTGRGIGRNPELARLGNGVVPLQAALAVATTVSRILR